jgi:hypothetical protein
VDKSLKRLKLERIDLYQLHRIDPQVPVEESLGALKAAQDAGKIRHVADPGHIITRASRGKHGSGETQAQCGGVEEDRRARAILTTHLGMA